MKKMIHIGLIFLLFVSCNNRRTSIDKNTIQELSEGDFKSPSQYGYLLLFVHSIDSVGYTNINILHHIYVRKYSADYNNFNSFLSDALNQEILFPPISLTYIVLKRKMSLLLKSNTKIQICYIQFYFIFL